MTRKKALRRMAAERFQLMSGGRERIVRIIAVRGRK